MLLHQVFHQTDGKHLLIHDVIVDGSDKRQCAGILLVAEVGPEQTGRIEQFQIRRDAHPLIAAGHAGAVARAGDGCAVDAVGERGFTDIRHADDHHADGLFDAACSHFGNGFGAGFLNSRNDILRLAADAVKAHAVNALCAEIRKPRTGLVFLRQIRLAQHEQAAFALDERIQIRISAGSGDSRIAKLDDDIHPTELIGERALRPCHMSGIPVDFFLVGAEHHFFVHGTSFWGSAPSLGRESVPCVFFASRLIT